MSKYKLLKTKGFILYLTKSQIKDLISDRTKGAIISIPIYFSNNQLVKTYKEVITINSENKIYESI